MQWFVIVVAAVGGVAVAIQGQFVGLMDSRVGTLASTFITYGSGGILIGIILALSGGGGISGWRSIPPFALASGAVGLMIIGSISFSVARLGLVPALMTLTAIQFVTAAVIDHFGLIGAEVKPLDASKISGLALLMVGTWLALR